MGDHLRQLKNLTDKFHPLPDQDWEIFSSIWKPFEARCKTVITAQGEVEKFLYFVIDGVQRVYYSDDLQHEATLVFTYAPSFGGVLDSFLLQRPSKYFYETLTPSIFLRAASLDVQHITSKSRSIQQLIQNGTNLSFSGLMERMTELQCFSSEEKFRTLLKRSPHILNLVPHKYLANYIGIDPTNFSKLINQIKI